MLDNLGIDAEYLHGGGAVKDRVSVDQLRATPRIFGQRPGVLLVRAPRDTVVSAYFQATRRLHVYDGPVGDFVRDPRFGIEKVARYHLLWSDALRASRFRLLEYEAMRVDTSALVTAVARHFGAAPDEAAIARAVAAGRFDVMRTGEDTGAYASYRGTLSPGEAGDGDSYKVRRGVVGGFRDYLTPTDQDYCDEVVRRLAYRPRMAQALAERGLRPE